MITPRAATSQFGFRHFLVLLVMLCCMPFHGAAALDEEEAIEIVTGDDQTIYEYRQNGVLMMIKVVPRSPLAKPYYMVPADGSAHYDSLEHKKKLYPRWVIIDW